MQPRSAKRTARGVGLALAAAGLIALAAHTTSTRAPTLFAGLGVLLGLAAVGFLAWNLSPTYLLCIALLLSPFSGNWSLVGLPGFAAPDRLALMAGIGAVLLRTPAAGVRPRLRIEPVHWLMLATALYAITSAVVVGSLTDRGSFFRLLEPFGILPFLLFLTAPIAFRTPAQRDVLLKTVVILGGYLGLTTLFETIHLDALVFPKYILDPNVGIHAGRGRGPFLEAVTNGYAQYVCAVICAIAWARWRRRSAWSGAAAVVALLCVLGAFESLQRSVWLGASVATLIALLALRETRRYIPMVIASVVVVLVVALALIPGLSSHVSSRSGDKQTIWDRQNLNRAGLNMVEQRPLFGFGWDQYLKHNKDYFQQADDYPITPNVENIDIHNVPLTYAVSLGLVGLLLWLGTVLLGVGGALTTRGPPDLRYW
ncbi:MAG: putative inorganic carbon ((-)) transporter, partial [Thermoleophilales bacterium]|nr:putative inorganic carbon ((-)) transporter [Thermoleophilales bacterium]